MLKLHVDKAGIARMQDALDTVTMLLDDLPSALRTARFIREISQAVAATEAGLVPSRFQSYEAGKFDDIRLDEVGRLLDLVRSVVEDDVPDSEPVEVLDSVAVEVEADQVKDTTESEWLASIIVETSPVEAERLVRTSADQHYAAVPWSGDWLLFGLHRNTVKVVDLMTEDLPNDSAEAEELVQTGMNFGLWSETNG